MTLRTLPEARQLQSPKNFQWDAPSDVLEKWANTPLAAAGDGATIDIFDVIGEGIFEKGITPKSVSASLRAVGKKDVKVRINSPGGNVFDGLAIYNLLRSHPARVDVDVVGLASSAASIIAMAGDEIAMGPGTFFFIHNSWGAVVGNRHDMVEAAATFEQFDQALLDIYVGRTEGKAAEISAMMDKETFIGPDESVKAGFADRVDDGIEVPEADGADASNNGLFARRKVEAALAKSGFTRSQRSELLLEAGAAAGARDAAGSAARDAGIEPSDIQRMIAEMRSFKEIVI